VIKFTPPSGSRAPINELELELRLWSHGLNRCAIGGRKCGAQRFVTPDDLIEARLERREIQETSHPRCPADIVNGAAGLQLFQKPEPFLGERQWQRFVPRRAIHNSMGQTGGAQQFKNFRFTLR
jgi:hypothetical protein